jgi:hypothetical protein
MDVKYLIRNYKQKINNLKSFLNTFYLDTNGIVYLQIIKEIKILKSVIKDLKNIHR